MKKIIFITFSAIGTLVLGQKASMSLDRTAFKIGEQATLSIQFEYENPNGNAMVLWPSLNEEISPGVEIVKRTLDEDDLIDSADARYLRKQDLVITVFEEGNYTIPSQKIHLGDSIYSTNDLLLEISTVEVDTASKKLYDIKPIYDINYPFSERSKDWIKENWKWLLLIIAILVSFFSWRYYQKLKVVEAVEPPVEVIPAHIIALQKLEQLLNEEKWKSPEKKIYYSELTDTVRTYLEYRFNIHAMEQTTREIIDELKYATISEEDKLYLRKILREADMVKFAKFLPSDEDAYTYLNNSIDFVKRTKQQESGSNGN